MGSKQHLHTYRERVRCSTSHIKSLPDNNSTQLPMEEKDEENSMETNLDPSKKKNKKTEH